MARPGFVCSWRHLDIQSEGAVRNFAYELTSKLFKNVLANGPRLLENGNPYAGRPDIVCSRRGVGTYCPRSEFCDGNICLGFHRVHLLNPLTDFH